MMLQVLRAFPLTCVVLALCVAVFLCKQAPFGALLFQALSFPDIVTWQEVPLSLRYLTPIFLHFSLMHIAFNLLMWWVFARQVEVFQSKWHLLSILLLGGIAPNVMQFYFFGPHFGGLSGVVYALLAYIWVFKGLVRSSRFYLPEGFMLFLIAWMLLGFSGWLDVLVGPMANYAHLGGLLSGLFLGVVAALWQRRVAK